MQELYTSPRSARIYRMGAELVRTGKAELVKGSQTLYVYGLSQAASIDTARLFSQEGVMCSDLRFVDLSREEDQDREKKELEDKIAALRKKIEIKELQIELWKANGNFSERTSQPASEVQEYIEKLAERLEGLNAEILAAGREIEELEKKLEKANEKLSLPVLSAQVTAPEDGTYAFELHYFENSAGWRSLYELRSDGSGPIEMRMRANIWQGTHEDWNGLDISLLTGNPTAAGSVPKLPSLLLDIRQPVREVERGAGAMMGMAMAKSAAMPMAMADGACEEAAADFTVNMQRMVIPEASVSQSETATEYTLPGKRDVLRTGDGTTTDIQTYSIPAEYRTAAVPRLDTSAFLVAAVKPTDLPVAGGIEASVYLNDIYSGKIWLDPEYADEEIEITLGKEERVFVRFKELPKKTSTALLKGLKVTEYGCEIRVSNESARQTKLVIKDRIPVSQNKDITVDTLELSGAEIDNKTGLVCWKKDLPAGEALALNLSYKVSNPKDKYIQEMQRQL